MTGIGMKGKRSFLSVTPVVGYTLESITDLAPVIVCTPDLNPPNEEEWLQYIRIGLRYYGFGVWKIERLIALATNEGGWKYLKP